jgi:toxin ParE1/3/4
VAYRVVFTVRAERQLQELYRYISEASGEARAENYVGRLIAQCEALRDYPNRGRPRFDIRSGLRTIGYKRRTTIAYLFEEKVVVILGVFYGGQDFERRLREDEPGD